jgi:hypothetical protein
MTSHARPVTLQQPAAAAAAQLEGGSTNETQGTTSRGTKFTTTVCLSDCFLARQCLLVALGARLMSRRVSAWCARLLRILVIMLSLLQRVQDASSNAHTDGQQRQRIRPI